MKNNQKTKQEITILQLYGIIFVLLGGSKHNLIYKPKSKLIYLCLKKVYI